MRHTCFLVLCFFALNGVVHAERAVPASERCERVVCVVPMASSPLADVTLRASTARQRCIAVLANQALLHREPPMHRILVCSGGYVDDDL
jgi:hypothetical protein